MMDLTKIAFYKYICCAVFSLSLHASNFVDFIHHTSRFCTIGQNFKALVWGWRKMRPLKTNSKCININKQGIFVQVSYRGMF